MDDDFVFVWFCLVVFPVLAGLLTWGLIELHNDSNSPAVQMCVQEKMDALEGTGFWSGETERGEAVEAVESYCWDIS